MKKYERYKDSGVQWLGSVPEHWEVMRFKHFMELITEPAKDGKKIGLENIESGTSKYIETESEFEGTGIAFMQNDIVYGKLRPYLRKVWQAEFNGNAVGDFFVFRNKKNSTPKYLKYLLLSEGFTSIATGSTEGAKMPRVSSQFILSLDFAIPTISEQESIANYLDSQVSKINSVITEKEKMISDMEKYRSSLISETVTKGLNPDVPMKDSGVDWIGEIPEHWDTIKAKYLVNISHGTDPKTEGEVPVYGSGSASFKTCGEFKEGDAVLVGRKGATLHIPHYITGRYWNVDTAFDVKAKDDYNLRFYYYNAICFDYNRYMSQTTLPGMTQNDYNNMLLPHPDSATQNKIVEYLDIKNQQIDTLVTELKSQIEDLKSYKQSLITEAVTGLVDVRDWTPNE